VILSTELFTQKGLHIKLLSHGLFYLYTGNSHVRTSIYVEITVSEKTLKLYSLCLDKRHDAPCCEFCSHHVDRITNLRKWHKPSRHAPGQCWKLSSLAKFRFHVKIVTLLLLPWRIMLSGMFMFIINSEIMNLMYSWWDSWNEWGVCVRPLPTQEDTNPERTADRHSCLEWD
jgi:hypothetical protein